MRVGILALQGDFEAHAKALERLGVEWCYVKHPEELASIHALILPGGESTTLLKFLDEGNFLQALRRLPEQGKPVFGTCAGTILLAREVTNPPQASLGLLDITVARNAYGRQIASRVTQGSSKLKDGPLEMVFIRAPAIERVGEAVEVLAWCDSRPVFVRQGLAMATTFHPELAGDTTVHEYFLRLVGTQAGAACG